MNDPMELHEKHARAITKAMAGLIARFGAMGLTPEAVLEGAVKGGAVVMIAAGLRPSELASLLHELAAEFEGLDGDSAFGKKEWQN